ncbi:Acetyl-/propionyl-coenzyme A carboxylase alpha chain [Salinivirga cyanobacteriivorans]|uniref:Acetyl-/propionyl-coenzyme A carboxylase alpha chain n=1 Tax=Salinivirga cyanobacteriivorans TaxID=1307839 RepID=A0A0S2HWV6_9BACT|nr:biotin carboxylase N-terminal domain-containing protein [Salinivirga cyanobacteriivorans]ALO14523.1 Acetyl-/propionyl-coenzyme A carboxylase alpha chain [Salinivirga cyanobacteriivorans]
MIRKLLIANRGEIARRIIRTAHDMGLETVSLYTMPEKNAPWVKEAHEAMMFSDESLSGSWLNADAIVEMALQSGADAVHPGYGFLSESAQFAKKVEESGLVFVGPTSTAIDAMGNKLNAAKIAHEAGVPVQDQYRGKVDELRDLQHKLEYPVLIKAAAGGGGKGMKKVFEPEAFQSALEQTAREAQAYFGNSEVYVERLLTQARHIEVQIIGDGKGNVIHLGERDCTLQRRHQKVIEESPAICLSEAQRKAVTGYAVQLGQQMKYRSAGTVEFMLDNSGKFWFLEMNTRIQVEHPVTELVTRTDIVKMQLQIADDHALRLKQKDIKFDGHAIEARLYAENPAKGFLPAAGPVHKLAFPTYDWLRVDAAIDGSGMASADYDPMLAKVIVKAKNRAEAIRRLKMVSEQTQLAGVENNLHYLKSVITAPFFEQNNFHTQYLEETYTYVHDQQPAFDVMAAFVMIALRPQTNSAENAWQKGYFRQVPPLWRVKAGNEHFDVHFRNLANGIELSYNNEIAALKMIDITDQVVVFEMNQIRKTFKYHKNDQKVWIFTNAQTFLIQQLLPESGKSLSVQHDQRIMKLEAPMYGRILQILANRGREIKAGDTLMVLEAMKMENHLQATSDAIVKSVLVKEGQQVADGQILMEFE